MVVKETRDWQLTQELPRDLPYDFSHLGTMGTNKKDGEECSV